MKRNLLVLQVVAAGWLSAAAQPQIQQDWLLVEVDPDAAGNTHLSSLAIQPLTGLPALSYVREVSGQDDELRYAWYDGAGWHQQVVATGYGIEQATLAFFSDGRPAIAYQHAPRIGNREVLYVEHDGNQWLPSCLVSNWGNGGSLLARKVGLIIGLLDDQPRVAYRFPAGSCCPVDDFLQVAVRSPGGPCGTWTYQSKLTGAWTASILGSLAADPQSGRLSLAYLYHSVNNRPGIMRTVSCVNNSPPCCNQQGAQFDCNQFLDYGGIDAPEMRFFPGTSDWGMCCTVGAYGSNPAAARYVYGTGDNGGVAVDVETGQIADSSFAVHPMTMQPGMIYSLYVSPFQAMRFAEFDGLSWAIESFDHGVSSYTNSMEYDPRDGQPWAGYTKNNRVRVAKRVFTSPAAPFWSQLQPAQSPGARSHHAMVFDSTRNKIVLFGGYGGAQPLGDTWEWDGQNWQLAQASGGPPARYHHAMAYDAARQRTVLYGGYNGNWALYDTWEWDGATWQQRNPSQYPYNINDHAMVYDHARGRTVLFGGRTGLSSQPNNKTWEWDGANWQEINTANRPSAKYDHAMVYEPLRGKTLLFGGAGNHADLWEYDGLDWTRLTPAGLRPTGRQGHAMAFDARRGKVVLAGGWDNGDVRLSDTWEWDGAAWTPLFPEFKAPGRSGHQLAFDGVQQRLLRFGGDDNGGVYGDTWQQIGGLHLTVSGATSGGTAAAALSQATPNGSLVLGYSLAGGGPITVNAGCAVLTLSLSPPFTQVNLTANAAGTASFTTNVPAGTTGANVWAQAFDVGSCSLSNGVRVTL